MDGAIPVEARKKPKSMATMAGPALMEPPRSSTTRMIANISTTDSEMATTDHTLGRSLSRPADASPAHPAGTIVPPTRLPYAAADTSSATPLAPGTALPGKGRFSDLDPDGNSAPFGAPPPQGIQRDLLHACTLCSQGIRIVAQNVNACANSSG